jgi:hypothetical protein
VLISKIAWNSPERKRCYSDVCQGRISCLAIYDLLVDNDVYLYKSFILKLRYGVCKLWSTLYELAILKSKTDLRFELEISYICYSEFQILKVEVIFSYNSLPVKVIYDFSY